MDCVYLELKKCAEEIPEDFFRKDFNAFDHWYARLTLVLIGLSVIYPACPHVSFFLLLCSCLSCRGDDREEVDGHVDALTDGIDAIVESYYKVRLPSLLLSILLCSSVIGA
jgi:hypothetical protein